MNGAEYLIRALENEGVRYVFGYPGGAIMPVYDAMRGASFKHILTRHEQGAAMAADGYARVSGQVGVCIATSGPGATNLVTGIANAYMDSVPLVIITGQVTTAMMGTDAFQEVDVLGITLPIVKHSFLPRTVEELVADVPAAFRLARSGRPGPVLIDLPKDVTLAPVGDTFQPKLVDPIIDAYGAEDIAAANAMIAASERPVIYAGGGIGIGGAVGEFRHFVHRSNIPVVCTLKGLGSIPGDDPRFLGMIGMHGLPAANFAVQSCDLLIVIGARLDDRATGKLDTFAPDARVIHLDIDPAEIGKLRQPAVSICGTLPRALASLAAIGDWSDWRAHCAELKREHAWPYGRNDDRIDPPAMLRSLAERAPRGTIVACDVGQHQMWVAQHYSFGSPEEHLTSGGLGAMGYGIPAALGAKLARPESTVICVSGDGSIMMNIQELATLQRYGIPIRILLFDNAYLGMVRQWQSLFFQERLSEVDLWDNPDFVQVAESFGVPGIRIENQEDTEDAIDQLLRGDGSLLVHAAIDRTDNVWPLVPPGGANSEMMMGEKT